MSIHVHFVKHGCRDVPTHLERNSINIQNQFNSCLRDLEPRERGNRLLDKDNHLTGSPYPHQVLLEQEPIVANTLGDFTGDLYVFENQEDARWFFTEGFKSLCLWETQKGLLNAPARAEKFEYVQPYKMVLFSTEPPVPWKLNVTADQIDDYHNYTV